MKILIFGATGMVGQGVLRECLRAGDVTFVKAIGRTPIAAGHRKLREQIVQDLFDIASYRSAMADFDACFFCLGVSSAGMSEADYAHITYDLAVEIASVAARLNPEMIFTYVSGQGTDSTGHGRVMWARVKGRLENSLLQMPFRAAYMLRPGIIVPLDGFVSKTRVYRILYTILRPIMPLLLRLFPNQVLTTRQVGQAMVNLARHGYRKHVLEVRDMREVAAL